MKQKLILILSVIITISFLAVILIGILTGFETIIIINASVLFICGCLSWSFYSKKKK